MTNERNRPESDAEVNLLVSRTYKEVANERTPEHLDRSVLKQAADAARPRYLRSISWTRPIAWAATITLCVGLVLEITRTPAPEIMEFAVPSDRADSPALTTNLPEAAPVKTRAPRALVEEGEIPVERKRAAKISEAFLEQDAVLLTIPEFSAVAPPACSETEVATAASWLLCIERLEDAGRTIEANEQRELLYAAFPAADPL